MGLNRLISGAKTYDKFEVSASPGVLEVEEVPPFNNGVKDSDFKSDLKDKGDNEAIINKCHVT